MRHPSRSDLEALDGAIGEVHGVPPDGERNSDGGAITRWEERQAGAVKREGPTT